MPEQEIRARGGAKKWRTVKLKDGRTVQIAVVRKASPQGPAHAKKKAADV